MKIGNHLIPKRHQSHFDELDIPCSQLLHCLVTSHYCPHTVELDLVQFLSSDLFIHQSACSLSTLKDTFSNIRTLYFQISANLATQGAEDDIDFDVDEVSKLTLFLLEAVLASNKPQLRALVFDFFVAEDLAAVMRAIAPMFYQPLYVPQHYSEGVLTALPYCGLKCLDISLYDGLPMVGNNRLEATLEIETILRT